MAGAHVCKYFGTTVGCLYGTSCRFEHQGPEPGISVTNNLSEPLAVVDLSPQAFEQYEGQDRATFRQDPVASFSWMTGHSEIAVPGTSKHLRFAYDHLLRTM